MNVNFEPIIRGLKNMTIMGGGGARRLMEKTILNFHFDYLTPPLIQVGIFIDQTNSNDSWQNFRRLKSANREDYCGTV